VNRATATKFLLGGIAVLAVLLIATGAQQEALPIVVILVLVGGLMYLSFRIREVPRRDAYGDTARILGMRYEPTDTMGLARLPHPLLHRLAETREVGHVLSGTWHGRDVTVFEYRYTSGADAQGQAIAYAFTCVVTPVASSWPDLVAEPERLPTKLADALALRDIDLELEAFNRAFEVRSTDPRFASAFLDARMTAWLSESAPAGFGVEIVAGRLLTFVPVLMPWQIDTALAATTGFLDQVPATIASLYPDPRTS
jgi:hypothetical protein